MRQGPSRHHLVAAAHGLRGQNHDKVRVWSNDITVRLLRGEVDGVLKGLRVLNFLEASQREARGSLLAYFESNRERLDYPRNIAAEYPISSALIEGAPGKGVLLLASGQDRLYLVTGACRCTAVPDKAG